VEAEQERVLIRAGMFWAVRLGLAIAACGGLVASGSGEHASAAVARNSPALRVVAPKAPRAYRVPRGAVHVRTVAQLRQALRGTRKNIVLADGTYDPGSYLAVDGAHSLYAQHRGKAIMRSGVLVGSNFTSGRATIRGLTFDVSSTSDTYRGSILQNWGPGGRNTRVLDCVFRGHGVVPYGIVSINPQGLDVERAVFKGFTGGGLRASIGSAAPYGGGTPVIRRLWDISVDGVARPRPGSSNGTAEAGIFLGHPVAEGVRRIRVRRASWAGIITANNSWNTTFSDVDIDMRGPKVTTGVGVYLEHFNYHNVFQRFVIRGARVGFNAEWADPSWGGIAGSHGTIIRDGTIDAKGAPFAKTWGVYLDEGTESTTVTNVVFRSQSFAAIGAYRITGTNRFEGNDTSGIRARAKAVSYVHYSASQP
jgi:hypothetical protein